MQNITSARNPLLLTSFELQEDRNIVQDLTNLLKHTTMAAHKVLIRMIEKIPLHSSTTHTMKKKHGNFPDMIIVTRYIYHFSEVQISL